MARGGAGLVVVGHHVVLLEGVRAVGAFASVAEYVGQPPTSSWVSMKPFLDGESASVSEPSKVKVPLTVSSATLLSTGSRLRDAPAYSVTWSNASSAEWTVIIIAPSLQWNGLSDLMAAIVAASAVVAVQLSAVMPGCPDM